MPASIEVDTQAAFSAESKFTDKLLRLSRI